MTWEDVKYLVVAFVRAMVPWGLVVFMIFVILMTLEAL